MQGTDLLRELAETSDHAYTVLLSALAELHDGFVEQDEIQAAELVDEIADLSLADTIFS